MANAIKNTVWVIALVFFLIVLFGVGLGVEQLGLSQIGPKILQFVFMGTDNLNSLNISGVTNTVALLITSLMVWLIVFVLFGDIIENFSALSEGYGWIIAFAMAVIAANVKLISTFLVWMTGIFIWAGAFTAYAALIASFVAFFAVQWGIGSLLTWVKNRQTMIKAATGRTYASEGLKTLKVVGKEVVKE